MVLITIGALALLSSVASYFALLRLDIFDLDILFFMAVIVLLSVAKFLYWVENHGNKSC